MLVARRRESWEIPSRPAMEPERMLVPPALLINKELMIFLRGIKGVHQMRSKMHLQYTATMPFQTHPYFCESSRRLVALEEAGFCLA